MSVTNIPLDSFTQASYTGATNQWHAAGGANSQTEDGVLHGYAPSGGLPAAGALIKAYDFQRYVGGALEAITVPDGMVFSTVRVKLNVHGNTSGLTPMVLKQLVVQDDGNTTGAITLDATLSDNVDYTYDLTEAQLLALGWYSSDNIVAPQVTARIWSGAEEGGGDYARVDFLGLEVVWVAGAPGGVTNNRQEEFYMDGWLAGKNGGWEVLDRETVTISNSSNQIFANCPAECSRITITPKLYDIGLIFCKVGTIVAATTGNTHKYDADVRAELYANQETFQAMRAIRLEATDADVVVTYWG